MAAQPEVGEVIVIDDQSTDRTRAILIELAERISKLRMLTTETLPSGWVGKNYAASLGASVAQGDWLLFTDADTYHYPGSSRRALNDAVDHNAVLVSYSPEQEMETFWERVLIPFVYCRLAARFSFAHVNDPRRPDAAANGQFLVILRDAYNAIGGHAAVAGSILEDVALARKVKENGYGIYFTAPIGVVSTRMYRTFGAMWQGWSKNLYPLAGGSLKSLLVEFVEAFPVPEVVLVFAALVLYVFTRLGNVVPATAAGVILGMLLCRHIFYAGALYRNRYPVSFIQYYVPGSMLYGAALLNSWWKNVYGAVIWKGRAASRRKCHDSNYTQNRIFGVALLP